MIVLKTSLTIFAPSSTIIKKSRHHCFSTHGRVRDCNGQIRGLIFARHSCHFIVLGSLCVGGPHKTGNFEYRHLLQDDTLTLSVSRNAPPMAIIEDERLRAVAIEPIQEIKRTKGSRVIGAGIPVWGHLRYYAKAFEKKRLKKLHSKYAKKDKKTTDRLASLLALVKSVQPEELKAPTVYAVSFKKQEPLASAPVIVRAVVDKEPARGPAMTTATVVVPKVIVPASFTEVTVPATKHEKLVVYQAAPTSPSYIAPKMVQVSPPQQKVVAQAATPVAPIVPTQNKGLVALDVASMGFAPNETSSPNKQSSQSGQPDAYVIQGQIELAGGLVATGSSTKLDIQWNGSGQSRVATVDYSTGLFNVTVPTLNTGTVTGRLIDESGAVIGVGEAQIDQSASFNQNLLQGVNILIESPETEIRGRAISAYDVDNVFVPIFGAQLFGPGNTQTLAEKNGAFQLKGLGSESTLVMEAYAHEHWGTRLITSAKRNISIPVFSNKMLESFFNLVGGGADNSDYGLIWGEVKKQNKGVQGVKVSLASAPDIKPVYFNALRIPDNTLDATATNGLFAFAKVPPGMQVITSQYSGRETPPSIVSVTPSHVSFSQILFKSLDLSGKTIDQVNEPIEANIKVVGTLESTRSTLDGFKLKVPSSDPVILVEGSAGPTYFTTRIAMARPEAKKVEMKLFDKTWVTQKLKAIGFDLSSEQSLVIGSVSGQDYRVILDDKSDPKLSIAKSEPQVFYFGEKGELDSSLLEGKRNSLFIMTNLQPGLHTLLVQSVSGEVSTSRIFVADPGIVNTVSVGLRP